MKLLPYIILCLTAGLVFGAFLGHVLPDPAGDIVEYYGITESVMHHGSISLSQFDIQTLSKTLHPEYFSDPGYYIRGVNGQRYPVHFVAYSLLLVPLRLVLTIFHISPLYIFSLGNTVLLFAALAYIMRYHIKTTWGKYVLFIAAATSPLISFLWWPGPDIFSMSLLLVSLFLFLDDRPIAAALFTALASWQSQPLIVICAGMLLYALWQNRRTPVRTVIWGAGIIAAAGIPYVYNYVAFGTWTPWAILRDYWTRTYGFGLQNLSLKKLYEQILDLNMGVFWYAPLLTIGGIWGMARYIRTKKFAWLSVLALASLFAFQTNPAWHYGTSGYGPSRHALVLIPFFIAIGVTYFKPTILGKIFIGILLLSQIYVLSLNNYIFPIFSNTLVNSPIATFVLDRWPSVYNPTPEIFEDRTNHTDLDHPTSAIYMVNGQCKKAYVLPADFDRVIATCGPFRQPATGSIRNPSADGLYINYE